jgi:hypothetical protein
MAAGKISALDCKDIVMRFVNDQLVHYDLDYQFGKDRIFLKMSTQNRLDALLKKKVGAVEWGSTRLKAQYRYRVMAGQRKVMRAEVPKVQRAVRRYLMQVRMFKRKSAVLRIERAWVKYHEVFFARKKLPWVKKMQKYIKQRVEERRMEVKIGTIRRGQELLKSLAQASIQSKRLRNYFEVKEFVQRDLYDIFWEQL